MLVKKSYIIGLVSLTTRHNTKITHKHDDHENNHIATHITTNANNDNYKNGDENEDNVAMTSLVTIKAAATTN